MEAIGADIRAAAATAGAHDVEVRTVLAPAWTTDWIDDAARDKLSAYGIAPPGPATGAIPLTLSVRCPQCGSPDTREVSRFSATGCKALWTCTACREPFEQFKAI
jgi:ring-1,2-phenylacetyl-CoA epoxidase subunit PaaD